MLGEDPGIAMSFEPRRKRSQLMAATGKSRAEEPGLVVSMRFQAVLSGVISAENPRGSVGEAAVSLRAVRDCYRKSI